MRFNLLKGSFALHKFFLKFLITLHLYTYTQSRSDWRMIDLRSDTLTLPDEPMLRTILTAQLGDDGRLEARVGLDGLGEDAQVPRRGDKRAPLRHRVADVERADGARNDGGQPPGRNDAPYG